MMIEAADTDPHLAKYIDFLGTATRLSPEGSVSRHFLKEARIRYRQYRRSGEEARRYWCWSAVQIAMRALEKEGTSR
jgi:hypothetical protein